MDNFFAVKLIQIIREQIHRNVGVEFQLLNCMKDAHLNVHCFQSMIHKPCTAMGVELFLRLLAKDS